MYETLIFAIVVAPLILFFVHAAFVVKVSFRSIEAVHSFAKNLIVLGAYNTDTNYYELMLYGMEVVLLNIFDWNPMCCIKPEYRELLKPYFDNIEEI